MLSSIIETLFPKRCLLCDNLLQEKEEHVCSRCEQEYGVRNILKEEYFAPLSFLTEDIVVLFHYKYCDNAIKAFKFQRQVSVGKSLAKLLAKRLEQEKWLKEIDFIVPVPLHRKAQHQRQFNQCEIIADVLGRKLGIPVSNKNLYRIKNNKPQHSLSASERYENIRGNFSLRNPNEFKNKTILLVDDVITTCSTLKACCEALHASENIKIYVAVLASSRMRF